MKSPQAKVMRRSLFLAGVGLVALGLAGCGSVPKAPMARQPAAMPALAERVGGTIEHTPSGMLFPAQVADFTREQPRMYDEAGLNVSAGYNGNGVTVTVYVYPIEPYGGAAHFSAKAHFDEARDQIAKVHPAMKVLSEQEVPPPRGAISGPGLFGRYEFSTPGGGPVLQLESLLYIYAPVGGRWIIKYRVTYPKDSLEARSRVGRFVESFGWTIRNGQ